jgi:hypothetical protein
MQKITYDIDAEKKIIFTRIKGEIDLFTLLNHMTKVESDKKFMTGFNTLADFEEAFINMSLGEIPRLRHHLKEKEKIRGSCKWAVLINSQTAFNFISMAIPELKLSKIKIKLFKNKQNALEWLLN